MYLNVTPENFPAIASQIEFTATGLQGALGAHMPACQPLAPGIDDVSLMIPEVLNPWGEGFFSTTAHGAVLQTQASAVMPEVGTAYSGSDILAGADVATHGPIFNV